MIAWQSPDVAFDPNHAAITAIPKQPTRIADQ